VERSFWEVLKEDQEERTGWEGWEGGRAAAMTVRLWSEMERSCFFSVNWRGRSGGHWRMRLRRKEVWEAGEPGPSTRREWEEQKERDAEMEAWRWVKREWRRERE
jgi:hypothetical protein